MNPEEAEVASKIALAAFAAIDSKGFTPEGKSAFSNYAKPNAISSRMSLGHSVTLAVLDSVVVGMIEVRDGKHISMLFVHPEYTNNGIGTKLLSYAIAQFRKEQLRTKIKQVTVHAADDSIEFYSKRGFRVSATRQERDGISFTTMAFPLNEEVVVDRKIRQGEEVDFYAFSGTGNTYYAVKKIASLLEGKGITVRCHKMEKCMSPNLHEDSVIGIAFPIAAFSTYPTALNFLKSLPEGNGKRIFLIATMGGAGLGAEGPIRKLLVDKGYSPIASKFFVMPSNYGNKKIPREKNEQRKKDFEHEAALFVETVMSGDGKWKGGCPGFSNMMFRMCSKRKPWNMFFRMYPIQVNQSKCTNCGRCMSECPAGAIKLDDSTKFPKIEKEICQSSRRCVGFCPKQAIEVPNKPAEQYACMSYDEFKSFGQ